jgi:ADP-sugar diphosphatase
MQESHSEDLVRKSDKYRQWKRRVLASGCQVISEKIVSILQRNSQSFYTALIDFELLTPEGQKINRCLALRGSGAIVVPIFLCQGEIKTIMVRQRRIVDGEFSFEFPAGGIEEGSDPVSTAINELKEELGIAVQASELIKLTDEPLKVCESFFDEMIHWFAFKREVEPSFLAQFENRKTGSAKEEEHIYLSVMDFREVARINAFQPLVGLQLLQQANIVNGLNYR